jgi:rod shape-determining protein MreB and related proteins
VGVDLGTSTSRVSARGRGVVRSIPSLVAVDRRSRAVVAMGEDAAAMDGRVPDHLEVVHPLREGVIAEIEPATALLRHLLRAAAPRPRLAPVRAVVCAPGDITDIERRAVADAALRAGARTVAIVEEPMAAAIGAGLPVAEAQASIVVDVGGGTTEVAVIALGGIVTRTSVRVGGDAVDAALAAHLKHEHQLLVGARTAEWLKRTVGSAHPATDGEGTLVAGRDLERGLPVAVWVDAAEARSAIAEPIAEIEDAVRASLERTPPELVADLLDTGLTLTGGGALLPGLDRRLGEVTGLPVRLAPDPLLAVAVGAGRCLEHIDVLGDVTTSADTG